MKSVLSVRRLFGLAVCSALLLAVMAWEPARAGDWRIVSINGVDTEGDARLNFGTDGAFNGQTGCNRFNGDARADNGRLVIENPVAATRMACGGDAITTQDESIVAFLQGEIDTSFDPIAGVLSLTREAYSMRLVTATANDTTASGGETAAGEEPSASSPSYVGVFGLSGPLNIREQPSVKSESVAKVLAGTILRTEGCERHEGRDWCRVQLIDASAKRGWAASEYLEPAPAALRAGQGVFDEVGKLQCAMLPGEAMGDCEFGVAQDADHSAVVVVYRPDGRQRVLFFTNGEFAYSDTSQAGGGFDSEGDRIDGVFKIRVDDERYEIAAEMVAGP